MLPSARQASRKVGNSDFGSHKSLENRSIPPGSDHLPRENGTRALSVEALLSYISQRCLAPGLLFRYEDGQPLTYATLVREIRAAL